MNVAVIGERSRLGEGELEGLVLGDIARGIEVPSCITGHRMWSIRGIQPLHLRSHFDGERCRLEGVFPILLDDLHLGHRRRLGRSWAGCSRRRWSRLRRSSRRGSCCCPSATTCS